MPLSLGFKACGKPVSLSDPNSSCLKALGETHIRDRCQLCNNFKSHTKKDQEARLKVILMEAALRPTLELSCSDSAPSTSALVQSAPPTVRESWHHSPSLVPKKKHKRPLDERGRFLVLKSARPGDRDKVRPVSGHSSSSHNSWYQRLRSLHRSC